MFSKSNIVLGALSVVGAVSVFMNVQNVETANADNFHKVLYVTEPTGFVTLDDNGNVVEASSSSLMTGEQDMESYKRVEYGQWRYNATIGTSNQHRTGRSTLDTEGRKYNPYSWVQMGNNRRDDAYGPYRGASHAMASGKGVLKCGYGIY